MRSYIKRSSLGLLVATMGALVVAGVSILSNKSKRIPLVGAAGVGSGSGSVGELRKGLKGFVEDFGWSWTVFCWDWIDVCCQFDNLKKKFKQN